MHTTHQSIERRKKKMVSETGRNKNKKKPLHRRKNASDVVDSPSQNDLERFAGSSDEEEPNDNNNDIDDDNIDDEPVDDDKTRQPSSDRKRRLKSLQSKEEEQNNRRPRNDASIEKEEQDSDNGMNSSSVGSDDDNDEEEEEGSLPTTAATGMANAIQKILGSSSSSGGSSNNNNKGTVPVVLSKTTTPLQLLAAKEKQQEQQLREKRRLHRQRNLQALHIPLSIKNNNKKNKNEQAISTELAMEQTHRRVATRGVVALFNAIAQHQKKQQDEVRAVPKMGKDLYVLLTRQRYYSGRLVPLPMGTKTRVEQQETMTITTPNT